MLDSTAPPLPDDAGLYLFRRKVAERLSKLWPVRAANLRACGEAGVKLRCRCCGDVQLTPYRCGARSCPVCAHIKQAIATERAALRARLALELRKVAETWDGKGKPKPKSWRLLTLTLPAHPNPALRFDPEHLAERVRTARKAWGPFWRSTVWGARLNRWVERETVDEWGEVIVTRKRSKRARRDTMAFMGLEVAPGGMVHIHAAIYGEYVPVKRWAATGKRMAADSEHTIQELWGAAIGHAAPIVDARAMRAKTPEDLRKALIEVLKYVSKGDKEPGRREERAAAIEAVFRGVRRVEMIGAVRAMPEAREAEHFSEEPASCGACGDAGGFEWLRIWSADDVKANGGFGVVNTAPDGNKTDDSSRRAAVAVRTFAAQKGDARL